MSKSKILAEGELTGHAHRTIAEDSFVENNVLAAPKGTTVKHEEHNPIKLPPGEYDISIVREYDHFAEEARQVID